MMALSCLNYHTSIGSEVVIILIVVAHIREVVTSRCHGSKISGSQKTESVLKSEFALFQTSSKLFRVI